MLSDLRRFVGLSRKKEINIASIQVCSLVRQRMPYLVNEGKEYCELHWIAGQLSYMRKTKFLAQYLLDV
ncbi:hypothetical protein CH272_10615 [Rhodococcus sp. 05-340-1]|nr:hypothetical protein CH271_28060 [Rhodococcus sp. 05-340-2]OZD79195.1 hypothetical protein CH272_10615 [Rhodococcus sp. 05-340-1]